MSSSFDEPLWQIQIDLKLAKLRQRLHRADGYSSSVFQRYVLDYLAGLQEHLDSTVLRQARADTRPDLNLRNTARGLDALAKYMRFFDSSLGSAVPAAFREHAEHLFSLIEPTDLILLRPQSDQTFETRLADSSLRNKLRTLTTQYFAFLDVDDARSTPAVPVCLPNVYIISYPGFLGDFLPLYPILGHEFGHVLLETQALLEVLNRRVHDLCARMSFPKGRGTRPLFDWEVKPSKNLIERWSIEFFCDTIGWHLYGEPFIYALWLILSPFPETTPALPFRQYANETRQRDATRLLAADRRALARSSSREDDPILAFAQHPSPGRRIQRLLQNTQSTAVPDFPLFSAWQGMFRDRFLPYDERFPDSRYETLLALALQVATSLYGQVKPILPRRAAADDHRAGAGDISALTTLLNAWIPACQTSVPESAASPFQTADWRAVLFASWISLLQAAQGGPEQRGADWPLQKIDFLYQSFDMTALCDTFTTIRRSLGDDVD